MNLLVKELDNSFDVTSFICESDEVNKFVHENALDNNRNLLTKVFGLIDIETNVLIGVIALSAYRINMPDAEKYGIAQIPSVLLGRIGVANDYRGQNFLRSHLIPYAVAICNIVKDFIGCRLLITEINKGDSLREYLLNQGFDEEKVNKNYHFLSIDLLGDLDEFLQE